MMVYFAKLLPFILTVAAQAATVSLPRPIFNQNRDFYFLANAEAQTFDRLPIPAYILSRALESSSLEHEKIQTELDLLFKENGRVLKAVRNLFPDISTLLPRLSLDLILDDYSSFKNTNPYLFRSFHLRKSTVYPRSMISLDTSGRTRSYWGPLLAHEIVHAMLEDSGLPIWVEEMLAQLVEAEAAGADPQTRIKTLQSVEFFPALFESRRPLRSTESYALLFLFGRYLKNNFGGWRGLRSLVNESCGGILNSLNEWDVDEVLCRLQKSGAIADPLVAERATRKGLLRHFYSALILNTKSERSKGLFFHPNWNGFLQLPRARKAEPLILKPSQAIRVDGEYIALMWSHLSHGLELYRYIKYNSQYRVFEKSDPDFLKDLNELYPDARGIEETYLILNTTDKTL